MNVDSMRMAAQRFRDTAELPPKVVAKKTKITPVIGRELKSIIKESPKTPYRELKGWFVRPYRSPFLVFYSTIFE
jgi:hypothetical protein